MQRWLERILDVPVAEQRRAALTLAYVFLAASACVVGRTVADTLFLARIGGNQLAWMYLVSALVVGAAAVAYARLARGLSLRVLVAATHLTLALGAVGLRCLLPTYHHDVFVVAPVYLLAELQGAMSAILFATVLNELFGRADGRGVFAIAGIGSTLAGIVFGALIAFQSNELHAANLLYIMAALQMLTLSCALTLRPGRGGGQRELPLESPATEAGTREKPAPRAYERWLRVLALVQFPAIMLVGYQWKVTVDDAYHLAEDSMAAYFGGYYAIVNAITLVFQAGFAGRLLKRLDPLPALSVFPGALLLTAMTALATSGGGVLLWAATLSKGSEVLRRSFGDPASQLLYRPLPLALRRRVIAVIGGGVKPISEALAALAIAEVTYLAGTRDISYLVAALAVVWLLVAHRCRRLYLEMSSEDEPARSRLREAESRGSAARPTVRPASAS
jgi:hypothetical protein